MLLVLFISTFTLKCTTTSKFGRGGQWWKRPSWTKYSRAKKLLKRRQYGHHSTFRFTFQLSSLPCWLSSAATRLSNFVVFLTSEEQLIFVFCVSPYSLSLWTSQDQYRMLSAQRPCFALTRKSSLTISGIGQMIIRHLTDQCLRSSPFNKWFETWPMHGSNWNAVIKTPFKDGCLDFVDKTFLLVVIFNAIFGFLSLGITLMHALKPKLLSRLRVPTVRVQAWTLSMTLKIEETKKVDYIQDASFTFSNQFFLGRRNRLRPRMKRQLCYPTVLALFLHIRTCRQLACTIQKVVLLLLQRRQVRC